MAVPPGSLLPRKERGFGAFELLARLATGGMAEIFLARRRADPGGLLVIKRVLPHLAEDPVFVRMFQDEARLSSLIEHPNVCRVYEHGDVGHVCFLAMEYLPGVTMAMLCQQFQMRERHIDARVVAGIIQQCCAGLHHAHELRSPAGEPLDVVHRDVSPANIFITEDGSVKLLDFGVAKASSATSRTNTGQLKGKNSYMSPEQILGKELDRRSDLFSLGICLYEGLTSSRLFARDTDYLTFVAITQREVPDIRRLRPGLPEPLVAVMEQALSRDPGDRPPTALALADAVADAMRAHGGIAASDEIAALIASELAPELAARRAILDAIAADREELADDGDFHVDTRLVRGELQEPPGPRGRRWWIVAAAAASTLAVGLAGALIAGSSSGGAAEPAAAKATQSAPAAPPVTAAAPVPAAAPSPPALDAAAAPAAALEPAASRAAAALEPAASLDAAPAVADTRPGFFSVDSQPWATIYANGKSLGVTPLFRVKLPPGNYKFRAVAADGRSQKFRVAIKPGRTVSKGRLRWE